MFRPTGSLSAQMGKLPNHRGRPPRLMGSGELPNGGVLPPNGELPKAYGGCPAPIGERPPAVRGASPNEMGSSPRPGGTQQGRARIVPRTGGTPPSARGSFREPGKLPLPDEGPVANPLPLVSTATAPRERRPTAFQPRLRGSVALPPSSARRGSRLRFRLLPMFFGTWHETVRHENSCCPHEALRYSARPFGPAGAVNQHPRIEG